jgi:PAS domain S-box-containing protein
MDIRTKLVFALVGYALLSMTALGVFTAWTVEGAFRDQTEEQLNGLAVFKQEAVEQVLAGWRDRVALVASRTQLRQSLAEYDRTRSRASQDRIRTILADAADASPVFAELLVHDREGTFVAAARGGLEAPEVDEGLLVHEEEAIEIRYNGIAFREGALPLVGFSAPLELDGEIVGALHAVLNTAEIEALSDNYDGLGDSGETIVVAYDADEVLHSLHPLRFPPEGSEAGSFVIPTDRAAAQSLAGGWVRFTDRLTDYRGEEVYIATRYIPETQWGLVVKIDEAEQLLPIMEAREQMTNVAITLAAFAILFGTFLGIRFAQPIHQLAEAAGRIAGGDLGARSGLKREDEVGLLGRTFDQMADSLEEQVKLLTEFRRFFDVSIDMLCIASTDGYFKKVNRAFVRELGWSEEELLSRPFISLVHPDDVRATAAEIQKLSRGTPTIRFTNRFLCMDGSYKRVRWNTFPEAQTGRLYAIARVRSEQPDRADGDVRSRTPEPASAASDAAAEATSREAS